MITQNSRSSHQSRARKTESVTNKAGVKTNHAPTKIRTQISEMNISNKHKRQVRRPYYIRTFVSSPDMHNNDIDKPQPSNPPIQNLLKTQKQIRSYTHHMHQHPLLPPTKLITKENPPNISKLPFTQTFQEKELAFGSRFL